MHHPAMRGGDSIGSNQGANAAMVKAGWRRMPWFYKIYYSYVYTQDFILFFTCTMTSEKAPRRDRHSVRDGQS